MRAAPAFNVTLHRFGAWQAAVWTVVLAEWTATLAWVVQRDLAEGLAVPISFAVSLACAAGWLGRSLARQLSTELRWDGQLWWVTRGAEPIAGHLSVAIDLGPWMLLRFLPTCLPSRVPTIWLPAQRRGLEADWHALRCSVHSPVPPLPPGAATDSQVHRRT